MLDLEVGRLAFEDRRDRVCDRLRSWVGVLAVRLEKIRPDRHAREAAFYVVRGPGLVGPGDVPIRVEHGDASASQVEGRPAHLLAPHGASVRLASKRGPVRVRRHRGRAHPPNEGDRTKVVQVSRAGHS